MFGKSNPPTTDVPSVAIAPGNAEVETTGDGDSQDDYDPFKERNVAHPTNDFETFTHLVKASVGTGILSMPLAFRYTGLAMGFIGTFLLAAITAHCNYLMVTCAHVIYRRTRVPSLSFPEVGEAAFASGPLKTRKFAKTFSGAITWGSFIGYFGTLSVYTVIIAFTLQQVIGYYGNVLVNERLLISALLVPLIFVCWVPNLKYLAPFSLVANILMTTALGITSYYLVTNVPDIANRSQAKSVTNLPMFINLVIFALTCVGLIMPLENNMKNPPHYIGKFGVLNLAMVAISSLYTTIGFLGYLKYGEDTSDSIPLNLPKDSDLAQSVRVLVAIAVFLSYALQFVVVLEVCMGWTKNLMSQRPLLKEYIIRTLIVLLTVLLAIAIPFIGPFIGLLSAIAFSIMNFVCPCLMECVTLWEEEGGLGKYKWRLWKNIAIICFGFMVMVTGTYFSMADIIKMYQKKSVVAGLWVVGASSLDY